MPIFITLKQGDPIMARGYGFWTMFWLVVRWKLFRWARVQMFQNDDWEWVPYSNVAKAHPISDDDFSKRNAELVARREAEKKRNPNPGTKPRLIVPGGPK